MATKNIKALGNAQAIGWTDALLSRLAANSFGLDGRLSITAPANASALSNTGYSLTGSNASSMIDLAGTWNTTGTPTLIKANVTDTASNAASLLMDLQTSATTRFNITKNGLTTINATSTPLTVNIGGSPFFRLSDTASPVVVHSGWGYAWGSTTASSTVDLILRRDAANTLALRNSTNAQAFNIYGTYTSGSVFERMFARYSSANTRFEIGTEHTGASARTLALMIGSTVGLSISTTGVATSPELVSSGGNVYMAETRWSRRGAGILLLDGGGPASILMGGLTSAFPALKRSSTVLQSRLADDSDFAPLQGQLRSHANATSETVTPTHTLRLFDAAGTEYRVPAIAV